MKNNPKVSIITVCYNSAKTIEQTIESVLSQDYPYIEYIVVDGNSKDGTQDIIKKYQDKITKYVSEKDKGIYDAMNKGIGLATGDIIGILNSDDFYMDKNSLRTLIEKMLEENTDSVFADLIIVDQENTDVIRRYYNSGSWSPAKFRFGWIPAHPTLFVKKELYQKHGLFSLDYKIASDFDLLLRFFYSGKASYSYVKKPLIRMRAGGLSTRGFRSSLLLNREIVMACRKHGVWTNLPIVLLKIPAKLLETIAWRWKAF